MSNVTLSTHPFGSLSDSPGLYAAYFNFVRIQKLKEDKDVYPDKEVRFDKIIEKVVRSHVLPNLKSTDINLYGEVENNRIKIHPSHEIIWNESIDNSDKKEEIVEFISKLSIMSKPIYVGKTTEKTIKERVKEHRKKLSGIEPGDDEAKKGVFSREDEFPHKLYRRGIEFKDLLIMCVPAKPDTPKEAIALGETLLQAIANPSLSVSN